MSMVSIIRYVAVFALCAVAGMLSGTAAAQSFRITRIDTSAFPRVSAEYEALDAAGKHVRLQLSQVGIAEAAGEVPVSVTPTLEQTCTSNASVMLVLDQSLSMMDAGSDNTSRWQRLCDGVTALLSELDLDGESRVCAVSYDYSSRVWLPQHWTNDPVALLDTMKNTIPGGSGSAYHWMFEISENNIFTLFDERPARLSRYVIYISDGLNSSFDDARTATQWANTTADSLRRHGIRFSNISLGAPNGYGEMVQRILSDSTGGTAIVKATGSIAPELRTLNDDINVAEVCALSWTAPYGCSEASRQRSVDFSVNRIDMRVTATATYTAPVRSVALLVTSELYFGNPAASGTSFADLTITAVDVAQTIAGLDISPGAYFTVLNTGATPLPFTLQPGESRTIRIRFAQGKERLRREAVLTIQGAICSATVRLVAGADALKIVHPAGGEILSSCDPVAITWKGVESDRRVLLSYSMDGGTEWTTIADTARKLMHMWQPGHAGVNCRIMIQDTASAETLADTSGVFEFHSAQSIEHAVRMGVVANGVLPDSALDISVRVAVDDSLEYLPQNWRMSLSVPADVLYPADENLTSRIDGTRRVVELHGVRMPGKDTVATLTFRAARRDAEDVEVYVEGFAWTGCDERTYEDTLVFDVADILLLVGVNDELPLPPGIVLLSAPVLAGSAPLHVRFAEPGSHDVRLIDMSGTAVYTVTATSPVAGYESLLPLPNVRAGVYVLWVTGPSSAFSVRILALP